MVCFHGKHHDDHDDIRCLVVTEVIRWVVIVIPLCLCVWRYQVIGDYPGWVPGADDTTRDLWYYGTATLTLVLLSVLVYLPVKVTIIRWRLRHGALRGMSWRPSILVYILLCGAPCFILILTAAMTEGQLSTVLDPLTVSMLQLTVLGLTFTEWMSKAREELLTYDLITAMADDFFYAYDVIGFFMLSVTETEIYHSNWVYACFAFSVISMFKYLPSSPVNLTGQSGPQTAASIIVSMICCDIPFLIIRLSTLIIFGFVVSDLIHPIKNIALIVFGCLQLFIIFHKTKATNEDQMDKIGSDVTTTRDIPQQRVSRFPQETMRALVRLTSNNREMVVTGDVSNGTVTHRIRPGDGDIVISLGGNKQKANPTPRSSQVQPM